MSTDKRQAIIAMARDVLAAIESGQPVTDSARVSLPRFAAMVEPHDADLAARIRSHIR